MEDVREPLRLGELKLEPPGQLAHLRDVRRTRRGQTTQPAEVLLKPSRADDLYRPSGSLSRVPNRVQIAAWFGDVAPGANDHFAVSRPDADFTLDHNGVLVLPPVQVRG